MADISTVRISELPEAQSTKDDDYVVIESGDTTKKASVKTLISSQVPSYKVTFKAADWSDTSPYMQTVSVPGVDYTDDFGTPELVLGGSAATYDARREAYSYISSGSARAGGITLWCEEQKPLVDLTLVFTRRLVQ